MLMRRVLAVLVAGALLLAGACVPGSSSTMTVTAWFDDVAGLFVGNDVAVRGVPVGSVTAIEPRGDLVEVTLVVESDLPVPATAGAVIANRSVATDRYVELTPPSGDGEPLADGDVIPVERTRAPVEFDDLLASLETLSTGLAGERPAGALRRLLEVGADVAEGNGSLANETVRRLSEALAGLAGNREELVGTVEGLDGLTAALADNDDAVRAFIVSVSDAADLLADERADLGASIRALSDALEALARFVRRHRDDLGSSLRGLTEVTDSLLEHQDSLVEVVEVLPLTMRNIGDAIGTEGPYEDRLDIRLPATYLLPENAIVREVCDALPIRLCPLIGTSPSLEDLFELIGGGR